MRKYWWVVSTKPDQKTMWVVGRRDTQEEANQLGYEECDSEFQCYELDSPNVARITSQLKAKRLKATGNIGEAVSRASHVRG